MTSQEDPFYNRRARGTPTIKFRHRFSLAVLAASTLFAVGYHYLPVNQTFSQKLKDGLFMDSEETKVRYDSIYQSLRMSVDSRKRQEEEDEKRGA